MAINSQDRDNRGSCQQIGFCFQGCKSGAKWSTLVAELPKGEDTGKLEVRSDAQVLKIEHDASGKVTGVLYGDKAGNVHRQKARIVAVAGNSIESPRLLLNSASSMFPDGLANSSGQVGRNYMRHTTRRLGPQLHLRDGRLRPYGRHVDRRRGHAAGDQSDHTARIRKGHLRYGDPERPFR